MKKILTSSITSTARQPFLDYSLSHLQDAYTEAINSLCKRVIPSYTTNDVVVLEGLVDSGTAGVTYNISAGSVYYNGEIYQIPATGVLTIAANVAVLTLPTTYHASDPVTMDNGTTAYVHTLRAGVIALATSGSGTKDYSDFKSMSRSPLYATKAAQNTGAASTAYTVQFDTVLTDDDSILNTGTGVFTPKKGLQKLTCQLTVDPQVNYTGNISINLYNAGTNTLLDTICVVGYNTTQEAHTLQVVNYYVDFDGVTTYKIVTTTGALNYDITSASICIEPVNNNLITAY